MIRLVNVEKARNKGLFFMFLLLLCCVNTFSQEVLHLSPRDAVELAIRNNLGLQTARLDLDTKQRKADLVWNQFLPTVNVSGTLMRDNYGTTATTMVPVDFNNFFPMVPPGQIYGVVPYSVSVSPVWRINASISASLTFSFAMIAGIDTIKADYQAGLATLDRTRLQIERDIRKTYNQILLLQENVVLLRENYANAERQAVMAEANYRAGLVPRLTMLQAQVSVANLAPTINELENSLKALQASFAMTLGLPYYTQFSLESLSEGSFEIPMDLAELISMASTSRPDIVELQRNIITLQYTRKATALQLHTPSLVFNWSLNQTFTKNAFKDNWFDSDSWRGSGNFTITLAYRLNTLFPFTTEGQGLQDLDNRLQGLYITMAQVIRGTELEIYTKLNSLEKTQSSMETQQAAVELAEVAYRLTEEAYRAGLQDFQTVQNSLLALSQAKLQLLTQQFNYLNDLIDLEYAVGVPFGTLSSRY